MAKVTDKRWKGHLINWLEIADMDSEDYELKPLNQRQVAVLLMLLEYQKWPTRWVNLEMSKAELLQFIGDIEYRLMLNQGTFLMTPEEYYDAHKRATYDAWNDIAKQIVSGRTTNISVGDDGTVSDPTDGEIPDVELPEDDPDTAIDEPAAAQMGGALEVAALCENVLEKIDALYGPTNGAPTYSAAEAETVMSQIWDFDTALLNAAITNYYSYRAANPRFLWVKAASFALYIYCNGVSARTVSTYLIEVIAFAFAKQNAMLKFWNALTVTAYASANEKGLSKPSTQYLDASCVPVAEQTLTNLLFAAARTTTPLKANHRMLMIVDGYALDTDGDIQDFFWFRTAAGVNTFTTPSFVHSASSNLPSQNQVVYNSSHHYEYTIDLGNLNALMTITMNKHASMNAVGLTYPVPFQIKLIDLGEYTT